MKANKTWNQKVVKKGNKALVLQVIKEKPFLSRAGIAQDTGLNKSTVSALVSELLEENLIYESGPGVSSGGRRPVMLLFNELAGFSIGIDIGVNYLLGLLTDLNGNIIKEEKLNFKKYTYEQIELQLFKIIDSLIASTPVCPYGVVGIGIGVPGVVNKEGEVLMAPNLGWKNINLLKAVEDKFDLPVTIANEANAGAYGEKKFGAGQDYSDIIYASVGIGIGAGLILNDQLYQGHQGFSGEIGHMTIELNGSACGCGNNGCWELYASEQALLQQAETLNIFPKQGKEASLEELIEMAEKNDRQAIQLFEKVGSYLGMGLNNMINTFNPEQIIIGNRMSSAQEWLKEPIQKQIKNHILQFQQQELQIDFSRLSTHSAALGVGAFATESFLKVKNY